MDWQYVKGRVNFMLRRINVLLSIFFTIAIALLAIACTSNHAKDEPEVESPTYSEEDTEMKMSSITVSDEPAYAHISIRDGTLTNLGMTILFENKSGEYIIEHGEDYGLEQMVDGVWYEMPLIIKGDKNIVAIANTVSPVETNGWSVDWSFYYGELTTGHYRLIKHITTYKYPDYIGDSVDYRAPEGEYNRSIEFDID